MGRDLDGGRRALGQQMCELQDDKPLYDKSLENLLHVHSRQADAFVLMRLEGLDASGAAAVLGCSKETARVHLHRALRRLTRELHEYLPPHRRVKS